MAVGEGRAAAECAADFGPAPSLSLRLRVCAALVFFAPRMCVCRGSAAASGSSVAVVTEAQRRSGRHCRVVPTSCGPRDAFEPPLRVCVPLAQLAAVGCCCRGLLRPASRPSSRCVAAGALGRCVSCVPLSFSSLSFAAVKNSFFFFQC
ncbi:uncharacterized protein Tco025E_09110 [Trypanosoma conorhini]|uniref:Uncharacterized protein n=1 Tax=Trypanosoma conorhini TaxID=83891 RepID=A0A3R7M4J6_9TRYP|nr:uncharacterized protein Tco025E_09110 [Trypanosoma conorhini]RNE99303.1 hypothetical protein Tco025E_09110 [Trypanosoma conorhini]